MKIIHTADLHLGQVIYQHYDRADEHRYFFDQLEQCCQREQPDALVVSGDVFDLQQPSATTWKAFTDAFVALRRVCPAMHMVITAGNHDSAARIASNSAVWALADTHLIGTPPPVDPTSGSALWQERYLVRLSSGYILALPYMTGERTATLQSLLDYVAADNTEHKPVVMMAHTAVTGSDLTGHDVSIGHLRTQPLEHMGSGYDYLALGHIHRPQTLGHLDDWMQSEVTYEAPVARYAGSALHVSCDETYPHSISIVELSRHGGPIKLRQQRIDELRHFYVLPTDGSAFTDADSALQALRDFAQGGASGYVRLRIDNAAALPSDFTQQVYHIIESHHTALRYNPKIIWTGAPAASTAVAEPVFAVADLQQMTDPLTFIQQTADQYPELDMREVQQAFVDVEAEVHRMAEQPVSKKRNPRAPLTPTQADHNNED